jgi:hypothetical protein
MKSASATIKGLEIMRSIARSDPIVPLSVV